ncbi:MAG: hypothetical protein VKJ24_05175 [Synechococcales bacterium]|nr:hypothetical protein [Synechococcales bacterium]
MSTLADEDQYWDWERKKRIYIQGDNRIYEGYAIEYEQLTQGMMIIKMGGHRSWVDPERRLVYVHSLGGAGYGV